MSISRIIPKNERATWGSDTQFLMSCIAMSVGFGNVWRFPFTAYENGGGAFLIPYLLVLMVVAKPIYLMEVCLAQFSTKNSVNSLASLMPLLKGVGFGQLLTVACELSYYCTLISIILFYLVNSFTTNLPWATCREEWQDDNITCIPSVNNNISNFSLINVVSSTELWFAKEVIKSKASIDDGIGWPDWKLVLFLLLTWLISFPLTFKGIGNVGRASYFLAIFPYVILFALLIRSVTLEGSLNGVLYFVTPRWEELLNGKVWYNAITQCLYSLGIGVGIILNYSSYNNFDHNSYRDTLIVTSLDTVASLLSGITIFGILGNLSKELGVEITEVITSGGATLAFITYPDAIAKFNSVPWLYSILFFLMLFILGVGSAIACQSCCMSYITDKYEGLDNWHSSLITIVVGFLLGLVYITPGGMHILTLVDYFLVALPIFVLTTVEVLIICWWYGVQNLCWDIEFMLKRKMGLFWRICWGLVTPLILVVIFIYFTFTAESPKYGNSDFPKLALGMGWFFFGIIIFQPFIWWGFYLYTKRELGLLKAILASCSFDKWKPNDIETDKEWKTFKIAKVQDDASKNRTWVQRKLYFLIGKN